MRLLLALAACTFPAIAWAADPVPVEIPNGDARLRAMLYKPDGNGPFAVAVGLHGCDGLMNARGAPSARYRDWAQRLNAAGFAVLLPDSYGSRGVSGSQCTTRSRAVRTDRERVGDIQAARAWLHEQAWVAGDRIALLGWSNGAIAALWAVRPRLAPTDGKADFRSAAALYPGCRRLLNAAWSTRVPTLVLVGGADDQNRPAECQQMVAGAKGRSARAVIQVYPGAYHDFDHPSRRLQARSGYAFSTDGSGRVHTGTNPAARADALRRVPEWLKR
jgi:dienelactone hydrolase